MYSSVICERAVPGWDRLCKALLADVGLRVRADGKARWDEMGWDLLRVAWKSSEIGEDM